MVAANPAKIGSFLGTQINCPSTFFCSTSVVKERVSPLVTVAVRLSPTVTIGDCMVLIRGLCRRTNSFSNSARFKI